MCACTTSCGTPRPLPYMSPRLYCALAYPWSAASRYHRKDGRVRFRRREQGLTDQDLFAPLIDAHSRQADPPTFDQTLEDLGARGDGASEVDRLGEGDLLRDVDGPGAGQPRAEHTGHQAGGPHAGDDRLLEPGC